MQKSLKNMFLILNENSLTLTFDILAEKPGVCPSTDGKIGICIEGCSDDSDCKGFQKCCSNGCGHVCLTPGKYLQVRNMPTIKA